MATLDGILPAQPHYYLLRLKRPGRHGRYAFHGGAETDIGLLVFPLLERAEQFCMNISSGMCKPERVSAAKFLKLAEKAGAICLADGPKLTQCKMLPIPK